MTTTLPRATAWHRTHSTPVVAAIAGKANTVRAGAQYRRREILTYVLAGIWLIDGGLQFQPFMYSRGFTSTLKAAGEGSPAWISGPAERSATLMAHHLALFNTMAALVQVAIAVGLMMRRTRRPALAASIAWGLMVWWLGEGVGTLFAGPASAVTGMPGAAVIYVFVAVLLWPTGTDRGQSVATAGTPRNAAAAKMAWLAFWALFVWETLRSSNRSPSALHDTITGIGDGEPGWIKAVDNTAASVLNHHGTQASVILAALFAAIAVAVFLPTRYARPLLALAIVLAAIIWAVGQDFGAVATGTATDLNSGPLLALLAMCYWPITRRSNPAADKTTRTTP